MTSEKKAAETSRRTVLKGAAWSAPIIASMVSTPLAAASDGDGTGSPSFVGSFTMATNTSHSGTGSVRVQSLRDIPAGSSIVLRIEPATSAGKLFNVQRNSDSNYLQVGAGEVGSSTVKYLRITRNLVAGERAFVNFSFSGYAGAGNKVTITLLHDEEVLAVWTNPKKD